MRWTQEQGRTTGPESLTAYQERLTHALRQAATVLPPKGQFVQLTSGARLIGIPTHAVDYIEEVPKTTPMPRLPRTVMGIGTSRGRVLIFIDFDAVLAQNSEAGATLTAETVTRRAVCLKGADFGLVASVKDTIAPSDPGVQCFAPADIVRSAMTGSPLTCNSSVAPS